jgi:hypothetical protein
MIDPKPKRHISVFENVTFPEFKAIGSVKAKIDTGAYTGSLHCTKIEVMNDEGVPTIVFSPFDHPNTRITTKDFKIRNVRSSNGMDEKRYFINTIISIRGEEFPIILSLADRQNMRWPVLIGRKFLRKNKFLVDVTKIRP